MITKRIEPNEDIRFYAMGEAVKLISASNSGPHVYFESPGHAAVAVAEKIADYITNGPGKSEGEK